MNTLPSYGRYTHKIAEIKRDIALLGRSNMLLRIEFESKYSDRDLVFFGLEQIIGICKKNITYLRKKVVDQGINREARREFTKFHKYFKSLKEASIRIMDELILND